MCCYLVNNGKAVRTQIQTGMSDGNWIEVVKKESYPTNGEAGTWEDFDGSEHVIVGDLSEISDGVQVAVADNSPLLKPTTSNSKAGRREVASAVVPVSHGAQAIHLPPSRKSQVRGS